jgi:hypothetical protein
MEPVASAFPSLLQRPDGDARWVLLEPVRAGQDLLGPILELLQSSTPGVLAVRRYPPRARFAIVDLLASPVRSLALLPQGWTPPEEGWATPVRLAHHNGVLWAWLEPCPPPPRVRLQASAWAPDYPQRLRALILDRHLRPGRLRVQQVTLDPAGTPALAVLDHMDQQLGLVPPTPGKHLLAWLQRDPRHQLWVGLDWHIEMDPPALVLQLWPRVVPDGSPIRAGASC